MFYLGYYIYVMILSGIQSTLPFCFLKCEGCAIMRDSFNEIECRIRFARVKKVRGDDFIKEKRKEDRARSPLANISLTTNTLLAQLFLKSPLPRAF